MPRIQTLLVAALVVPLLFSMRVPCATALGSVTSLSGTATSGDMSGTAEQDLQRKRKIFKDSVVKLWQDYKLNGAYFGWVSAYGNDATKWPARIKQELVRRDRQKNSASYVERETVPQNPDDDDVEIAAADVRKDVVWGVVAPALAEIGDLVTLVGEGPKELGVDLVKAVLQAEAVNENVTQENAQALIQKYAPDFGKLSFDKKLEVIASLVAKFSADIAAEVQQLKPPKVGGQAASGGSSANIAFDAATGLLTISGDTITSVDATGADTAVGANVTFPQFSLLGTTPWSGQDLVFTAADAPSGAIERDTGNVQFLTEIPSLVYVPQENVFAGVLAYGLDVFGNSPFLDQLGSAWQDGPALFPTISIRPFDDFLSLTNQFQASASSAFVNLIAVSQVPEPPMLILLVSTLAILLGIRANATRVVNRAENHRASVHCQRTASMSSDVRSTRVPSEGPS